jgi:hypothetical protein
MVAIGPFEARSGSPRRPREGSCRIPGWRVVLKSALPLRRKARSGAVGVPRRHAAAGPRKDPPGRRSGHSGTVAKSLKLDRGLCPRDRGLLRERRRLRGSQCDESPSVSPGGGTPPVGGDERRSKARRHSCLDKTPTERPVTAHSSFSGRAGACRRGRRPRRRGDSKQESRTRGLQTRSLLIPGRGI